MHHVKRNIDAAEEHFSSENINSEIGFNCVPTSFSQITRQAEVIPEVVFPEISKLNDSVMIKK